MPDQSFFLGLCRSFQKTFAHNDPVKTAFVDSPEMIKIDMIGTQPGQACFQMFAVPVCTHSAVQRALGGKQDLVTESFYSVSKSRFAVGIAVKRCSIKIIDAVFVSVSNHFIYFVLIYKVLFVFLVFGKTHAAETECGNFFTGLAEITVKHRNILPAGVFF